MGHFLDPATRDALTRLAALDDDPESRPIDRIRAIRDLALALDADAATLDAVRGALGEGGGWDAISQAASLKPAAAKWRWAGSDEEISARHDAGRKRGARPSTVPTDLPGLSVADAARTLGVTPQAVYLQISRGRLASESVELPDGRRYKRVMLPEQGIAGEAVVLDRHDVQQHNEPTEALH